VAHPGDWISLITAGAVLVSWLAFGAVFLHYRRSPTGKETRRERGWVLGFLLQMAGYATVWGLRRGLRPIAPMPAIAEAAFAVLTVGLAAGSIWVVVSAANALGKQWALTARLVEGHELITRGPYGRVRHPIYTGMFGLLLATGLAISHWMALAAAIALFWTGTVIRVRREEKLLRQAFGTRFEEYARRVPAVLPGIY